MAQDKIIRLDMQPEELTTFLTGLPKSAQRLRRFQAARFFDVAVQVQHTATDYVPIRTGRLRASIGEYAVRDDETGQRAKRGTSNQLSVGATVFYSQWLHDGWINGDPWFLGLGTQPKSVRKGKPQTFRVPAADGSGGSVFKKAYRFGGSAKAFTQGKAVGMRYLQRAFEEHVPLLLDWPGLAKEADAVVVEAVKEARRKARTRGRR